MLHILKMKNYVCGQCLNEENSCQEQYSLEKKELNRLSEDFFGSGLANSLQTLEKFISFLSFLSLYGKMR